MKRILVLGLWCGLASGGWAAPKEAAPRNANEVLKPFFAAKEKQARLLGTNLNLDVHPQIWDYYRAAAKGDWKTVTNLQKRLAKGASQYEGARDDVRVGTAVWQTVIETECAREFFQTVDYKLALMYAHDVTNGIPAGAIYFGGTDPGRGVITAVCKDHAAADPFFTITQNALADGRYLIYLREMYGRQLYIPSNDDSQECFQEYTKDAAERQKAGKLKSGEDVRIVNGRVQVSGQVAVMAINARLVKVIFDKNPRHDYYIEESFPLDWMFPHLAPHGAIFRLHREPIKELSEAVLAQDRAFWKERCDSLLGDWLKEETSLREVCDFVEKVHVDNQLKRFKGNLRFLQSDAAKKTYGKLRAGHAGLYAWRYSSSESATEREAVKREADLAFRQAFALCPYSPEAVFRYVNFLNERGRYDDSLLLARTALATDPLNQYLRDLVAKLRDYDAQRHR